MRIGGSRLAATLVLILAACDSNAASMPVLVDTSDGGEQAQALVPDPPALPSPPVLTPCPEGWREVMNAAGIVECDPWPESGHADCADDEAHFVGEPSCTRIGPPCPEDGFPEGLPSDRTIVYVREGATAGDGSREAPFGSIAQGIRAVAASGGVVAIATGRYDEWVKVSRGVTLWGACVGGTMLTSSVRTTPTTKIGVVTALGPDVVVRSLTIDAPERSGIVARSGATLDVEDVVVRSPLGTGLMATDGAGLTGRSIAIRASRPRDDGFTDGLVVQAGARAELERVALDENQGAGVHMWNASSLVLRRASVRSSRGTDRVAMPGRGIEIGMDSSASVQASCIEGNSATGVAAVERSSLVLDHVLVRDNGGGAEAGTGIDIIDHSSATVRRSVIAHNEQEGIFGMWDAMVDLEDVVVRDTADVDPAPPGQPGFGDAIRMQFECLLRVERALLYRNHTSGIALLVSRAELEDVAIEHTMLPAVIPPLDPAIRFIAPALDAHSRSQVRVARLLSRENAGAGIALSSEGTVLEAEDVTIVDTTYGEPPDLTGGALTIENGASATIARARIASNRGAGVSVMRGSWLDLTDGRIEDTLPLEATGFSGRGIEVVFGSTATIRRTVVDRTYDAAVLVVGEPLVYAARTDATFEDFEIHDVREAACARDGSCDPAGMGVVVLDARAHMTRFVIDDAELCGVQLGDNATLDLSQGRIAHTSVGACVQSPGYDLMRLTDRVRFEDNGTNISATTFYIPEPSASDSFTPP